MLKCEQPLELQFLHETQLEHEVKQILEQLPELDQQ
jgi:hypothetical protein